MRQILTKTATVLVIGVIAIGASACRDEEQGRVLNYEKGTYLGTVDTALSANQLSELVSRSRLQNAY